MIDSGISGFTQEKTISHIIDFGNRVTAELIFRGADIGEIPQTEGTLYWNRIPIAYTDPDESFFGDWTFEIGEDVYVVTAIEENNVSTILQATTQEMFQEVSEADLV